jgi:hypothetical protein
MAKITLQMLQEKGACESQVRLFQQTFGDSVELTEELAKEYGHLFNSEWAAEIFLSDKNAKVYSAAVRAAWTALTTAENIFSNTATPAYEIYRQTKAVVFVRLYNAQQEVNRAQNVALFGFATFLIVALAAWIGVML